MTDPNAHNPNPVSNQGWFSPGRQNAQLVYGLYLLSFVVGITGIIGVIMAYLNRGKGPAWVDSHYTYAIRTFWIGILYAVISGILMVVLIGGLLLIATIVWIVVRCLIGLQRAGANQPIERPESWWI